MAKKIIVRSQPGFTIVELMVATTVLSIILLLATVTMTSIGNLYTKGVNQSATQDTARNIIDGLAQNLELSNGYTLSPDKQSICIGAVRYTYVLGKQIGSAQPHVLWRDTAPAGCANNSAVLGTSGASGGSELMAANSRLGELSISTTSPYVISVQVAYGDDDLLCNANAPGDCALNTTSTHLADSGASLQCKGNAGDQFCAVSTLTTTVVPRIHKE